MRSTWAEVNLGVIRRNLEKIQAGFGEEKGKIIAIVKANAYGHGAKEVSRAIEELVEGFGVATVEEGVELRKVGIEKSILVLGAVDRNDYDLAVKNSLEISVFSREKAQELKEWVQEMKRKVCPLIQVKVETGMNRLGFEDDDRGLEEMKEVLVDEQEGYWKIQGIFSHMWDAGGDEEVNRKQWQKFEQIATKLEKILGYKLKKHLANSGTIETMIGEGNEGVEGRNKGWLLRPGILIYGYAQTEVGKELGLEKALSLKSKIVQIRNLAEGEVVGYGGKKVAGRGGMRVGILSVGYADGIWRTMGCGRVSFSCQGVKVPIVGNVCMDQLMIDISEVEEAEVGEEVEIYGKNNSIEQIAAEMDTIAYELLTGIGIRIPRVYRDG